MIGVLNVNILVHVTIVKKKLEVSYVELEIRGSVRHDRGLPVDISLSAGLLDEPALSINPAFCLTSRYDRLFNVT